ncbi:hypothetical protein VNO80_11312 [Phaseolus coccineus]|uniref:Transmembrane protein n=1 Tax=Phaseolus coccineus TaxID=3886 RepID=A0AAN9RE96_PHACN
MEAEEKKRKRREGFDGFEVVMRRTKFFSSSIGSKASSLSLVFLCSYHLIDLITREKAETKSKQRRKRRRNMVRVASYFAMTLGAFVFWHSMDKVHVWIALHQDEKQERMEKEAEIRRVREELLKQQANQKDSLY